MCRCLIIAQLDQLTGMSALAAWNRIFCSQLVVALKICILVFMFNFQVNKKKSACHSLPLVCGHDLEAACKTCFQQIVKVVLLTCFLKPQWRIQASLSASSFRSLFICKARGLARATRTKFHHIFERIYLVRNIHVSFSSVFNKLSPCRRWQLSDLKKLSRFERADRLTLPAPIIRTLLIAQKNWWTRRLNVCRHISRVSECFLRTKYRQKKSASNCARRWYEINCKFVGPKQNHSEAQRCHGCWESCVLKKSSRMHGEFNTISQQMAA